ncbi:hypothetical protein KJ660_01540 [Candidatus Micrarchaeota archaeon]|nr:hypothetical protein [Candidatus Micrarchaeota archaeon]
MQEKESVTSLSRIIDEQIDRVFNEINLEVEGMQEISAKDLMKKKCDSSGLSAIIYSRVRPKEADKGEMEVKGNLVSVMPIDSMLMLIDLLEGKEFNSTTHLNDRKLIPVKRTWNDLLIAFIQGINNYFKIEVEFSEPKIVVSLKENLADFCTTGLIEEKNGLLVEAGFDVGGTQINGKLCLFLSYPDENNLLKRAANE